MLKELKKSLFQLLNMQIDAQRQSLSYLETFIGEEIY